MMIEMLIYACFPFELSKHSFNSFRGLLAGSFEFDHIKMRYMYGDDNNITPSSVFGFSRAMQTLCDTIYNKVDLKSETVMNNFKQSEFLSPIIDIMINVKHIINEENIFHDDDIDDNIGNTSILPNIEDIYINGKKYVKQFEFDQDKFKEIILICSLLINDNICWPVKNLFKNWGSLHNNQYLSLIVRCVIMCIDSMLSN